MCLVRRALSGCLGALLVAGLSGAASAQVASLETPGPGVEASEAPAEDVNGQEAILRFVACLRDEGFDIPDPRFGPNGNLIGTVSAFAAIDVTSPEFLDGVEACQSELAALQPELDPEQQAERNEELLRFAECMRGQGIVEFPDPDPVSGLTVASFRGEDGRLTIDPFNSEFLDASSVCRAEVGLELVPTPSP
jgi:hypothetical protein